MPKKNGRNFSKGVKVPTKKHINLPKVVKSPTAKAVNIPGGKREDFSLKFKITERFCRRTRGRPQGTKKGKTGDFYICKCENRAK